MPLAIIAGTGIADLFETIKKKKKIKVSTPYGDAIIYEYTSKEKKFYFLPRHGKEIIIPPHQINYQANIWALKEKRVKSIISASSVGSLRKEIEPGHFVLVNQFIDFTKARKATFFDSFADGVKHIDLTEPYCPRLRRLLSKESKKFVRTYTKGVYVCTEGPRFETPAEIAMFKKLGADVVGMTGVPEVVLARELSICYGNCAVATNYAAGISKKPLTYEEVVSLMKKSEQKLFNLLLRVIKKIDVDADCICQH